MKRIIFFPYTLKEQDIKELTDGIISLSDFYTNTQEFNNKYTDYNQILIRIINYVTKMLTESDYYHS